MSDAEDVLRRITEAIEEAKGCFDAAVTEGLYERLRENEFAESGSIRGLVERRMIYAYKPIEEAIALARILEAQIEGYKRALQFYADPLNYKYVRKYDDTRIGYDEGKTAQDALGHPTAEFDNLDALYAYLKMHPDITDGLVMVGNATADHGALHYEPVELATVRNRRKM